MPPYPARQRDEADPRGVVDHHRRVHGHRPLHAPVGVRRTHVRVHVVGRDERLERDRLEEGKQFSIQ